MTGDEIWPGLIDGAPYLVIAILSLWLQWKAMQGTVSKLIARQNEDIQARLDAQTRLITGQGTDADDGP